MAQKKHKPEEIVSKLRQVPEAKAVIESWRQHYNTRRPHSSLGYKPPAPATIMPSSSVVVKPTMH